MSVGAIHEVAGNLHLVEGHHPHRLHEDPDIPTIAVYRTDRTLYLLDTGVGPVQRDAIRTLASRDAPPDELVLLNSHGHIDHLGNNDLVEQLAAGTRRHLIPRAARASVDFEPFFRDLYRRGLPYFDYLEGLDLDPTTVAGLLQALGAPADLDPSALRDLGRRVEELGLRPAIAHEVPSLVIDLVLRTYPAVFPSTATMTDYEDHADAGAVTLGSTTWQGWDLGDVQVLLSEGHSGGGTIFYLPEHRFLMLADETSTVPIWADTHPRRTADMARRALTMIDEGLVETVCAGHRPMLPVHGDDARALFVGLIDQVEEFGRAVTKALDEHPDGAVIDELYRTMRTQAAPDSLVALLLRLQFPVFGTFLKLTILNHCLLSGFTERRDPQGRITFTGS